MGYPYDFVKMIESAFPSDKKILKAVRHGGPELGELLQKNAIIYPAGIVDLYKALKEGRVEEVKSALEKHLVAKSLFDQWKTIMK